MSISEEREMERHRHHNPGPAGYFASKAGWTITSWVSFGVSLWLFYFAAYIWMRTRKKEYPDEKCQMVFTDDGFSYGASGVYVVSWADVKRVRETPVFWAIHFVDAGRNAFVAIPIDIVDSELRSLIDDRTSSVKDQ